MDELLKHINEGKSAIIRIIDSLEQYEIRFPVPLSDWARLIEEFEYMKGYTTCLGQYNLIKEPNDA